MVALGAGVQHDLDAIIRTRMLMIAAGYEDGNDADISVRCAS